MRRPMRVEETRVGITGEATVEMFDRFQESMGKKGYFITDSILEAGITTGKVLEIGPGPGRLGHDWLGKTGGTTLVGAEISGAMVELAERNARNARLENRCDYQLCSALELPFEKESFHGVFSNGSFHEWENPLEVFNQAYGVLKRGGKFVVGDLRRDIPLFMEKMALLGCGEKVMKKGFLTSLGAAYTPGEADLLMQLSHFHGGRLSKTAMGMILVMEKS